MSAARPPAEAAIGPRTDAAPRLGRVTGEPRPSEGWGDRSAAVPRDASLRQRTLSRLSELDLRPSRDLGQNFLVDERFLDVVEAAAELSPADAVLEVGGGLGVLSERLAPRVGHLHVVEVDRALASVLEALLAPFGNVTLHRADAVRVDFAALRPAPTKLVANLPYGVAATVLLKSLEELPGAGLWVAMVQREVAERLAARPGSRVYGATSVLAQLACDVHVHRRVPRSAFQPAPNVDSAVVVLRRRRTPADRAVTTLVRGAFSHRRKTLAGSLALFGGFGADVRERARAALVQLGQTPDARAERLSAADFEALAGLLGERVQPSERPPGEPAGEVTRRVEDGSG